MKPSLIFKKTPVLDRVATGTAARKYREEKNVTQQDLADKLGMKAPNLSLFESGKRRWSIALIENYTKSVDKLAK